MSVSLTLRLRWNDIDRLGHLTHLAYHQLMAETRLVLFQRIADHDTGFVLVRVELEHHAEVPQGVTEVEVRARVAQIGRSSLTIEHALLRPDGVVAADAKVVIVAWDPVGRCSRPLTDDERQALESERTASAASASSGT